MIKREIEKGRGRVRGRERQRYRKEGDREWMRKRKIKGK